LRAACAERKAFISSSGSNFAIIWPACTLSPQIDGALDHASADPKPQRGFVAWPHMPRQGDRFTEVLLFNGDGANGPDVWKDRLSFAAAPRRESRESDNHPAKPKFRPRR
jgi:hypothetical protein